mmetsp:Transcript_12624/g.32008  ORF Transcript_12624/g.32008 Transcript_12624/m.32008 type:complete len:212 (-) Transcript_12624:359-994(-)
MLALDVLYDGRKVRPAEFVPLRRRQLATPRVENLDALSTGFNLVAAVGRDAFGDVATKRMKYFGRFIRHFLDGFVRAGTLSFHDVGSQGPRRTHKAQDCRVIGHPVPPRSFRTCSAPHFLPEGFQRVADKGQGFEVYPAQPANILQAPNGIHDERAFGFVDFEGDSHRIQRREDVAEKNDPVWLEGMPWLQTDLDDQISCFGPLSEPRMLL